MSDSWTDAMLAALAECVARGATGAETAREVSEVAGRRITRNAIIGKAHRLSLALQSRPYRSAPRPKMTPEEAAERKKVVRRRYREKKARIEGRNIAPWKPKKAVVVTDASYRPPLNLPLEALTDAACKWPEGEGAPFTFCGQGVAETPPGRAAPIPYCGYHARLAYQPADRRAA